MLKSVIKNAWFTLLTFIDIDIYYTFSNIRNTKMSAKYLREFQKDIFICKRKSNITK